MLFQLSGSSVARDLCGKMIQPQFKGHKLHWRPALFSSQEFVIKSRPKKMADVWPVENVWSIVKQKVKAEEHKTRPQLKNIITAV